MTRIGQFNKKITHTSRVVDAGNNKDLRGIFGEIDPTDSATTNKTYWSFVEPLASKEVFTQFPSLQGNSLYPEFCAFSDICKNLSSPVYIKFKKSLH